MKVKNVLRFNNFLDLPFLLIFQGLDLLLVR